MSTNNLSHNSHLAHVAIPKVTMGNSPLGVVQEDTSALIAAASSNTAVDNIPLEQEPQEQENIDLPSRSQDSVVAPPVATIDPTPVTTATTTNKRSRISYWKKNIRAPHSFWLDPSKENIFKERFSMSHVHPLYLEGRIKECPNKKNNNRFLISWNLQDQNAILDEWVTITFPSTKAMKEKIRQYIDDFTLFQHGEMCRSTETIAESASNFSDCSSNENIESELKQCHQEKRDEDPFALYKN